MTGLSILALLGKNTTTIVEPKFHNGFPKEWLERYLLLLIKKYLLFLTTA